LGQAGVQISALVPPVGLPLRIRTPVRVSVNSRPLQRGHAIISAGLAWAFSRARLRALAVSGSGVPAMT
jgi:hypothetical protein